MDGFRATLTGLSLLDLLQMLHLARQTTTLVVGGDREGRLHLDQGELVHAAWGDLEGAAALRQLLMMRGGVAHTRPGEPVTRTLSGSFEGLMLDLLRQIDEERNRLRHLDPDEMVAALGSAAGSDDDPASPSATADSLFPPPATTVAPGPASPWSRQLVSAAIIEPRGRLVSHFGGFGEVIAEGARVAAALGGAVAPRMGLVGPVERAVVRVSGVAIPVVAVGEHLCAYLPRTHVDPVSAEAAAELFVIETVGRGHAGRPAGPVAAVGGA